MTATDTTDCSCYCEAFCFGIGKVPKDTLDRRSAGNTCCEGSHEQGMQMHWRLPDPQGAEGVLVVVRVIWVRQELIDLGDFGRSQKTTSDFLRPPERQWS